MRIHIWYFKCVISPFSCWLFSAPVTRAGAKYFGCVVRRIVSIDMVHIVAELRRDLGKVLHFTSQCALLLTVVTTSTLHHVKECTQNICTAFELAFGETGDFFFQSLHRLSCVHLLAHLHLSLVTVSSRTYIGSTTIHNYPQRQIDTNGPNGPKQQPR